MLACKLIFQSPKIRTSGLSLTTAFFNTRYVSNLTPSESVPSVLAPDPKVPRWSNGSRTFSRSHNISTLNPEKLVKSDFIDLRQQAHIAVRYRSISSMLCPYLLRPTKATVIAAQPFPAGTHGYLYLHRPLNVHPCAARLRFRICDNSLPPQEAFSRGNDLLLPKGAPWEISLLQLLTSASISNFRESFLLDGFTSEETLSQMDGLLEAHKKGTRFHSRLIFSFGQPFSVSMGQRSAKFGVVNLENSTISTVQLITAITDDVSNTLQCTMCLEYDPSTRRRIVMRVLQIPEEFRGETSLNKDGLLPFRNSGRSPPMSLADVLHRQSPSLQPHPDQSGFSI
ncbi:hypothetical protein BDP27DRAFT_1405591 [Rhodocollybia butyracea]|uniref:Uncharacterized protein n=1 Tax=Rhodocollybia butyracea TaxID=206335 RepID=A0A9P5U3M9_9AGAR|nr:hypothetical protein BDP27DRAFT_1405591 [Rhodocollybia butyracea]